MVCPSGENALQFNTIQCICEKKVKTTWDRPRAKWKDRITEMLHHSLTIMAAWRGNNSFVTPSTLKLAKEEVEKKEILFSTNNYYTVYCLHIGCVSSGTCYKVTMKHMSDYLTCKQHTMLTFYIFIVFPTADSNDPPTLFPTVILSGCIEAGGTYLCPMAVCILRILGFNACR